MIYNLEERVSVFGENIIVLCKKINRNEITRNLISQLVRSATSVGANYMEANEASSNRDFVNKIRIALKEARETEYWIELLAKIETDRLTELRVVWSEAHQLTLIFGKISSSSKLKI